MNTNEMIFALDEEISRLRQIRELLSEATQAPRRRGRPKGSANKAVSFNPREFVTVRRTISAEGRERIASAQRARWAKQHEPSKNSGRSSGDKTAAASSAEAAAKRPSTTKQAKRGRPSTSKSASVKRPVGRPPGSKNALKKKPSAGRGAAKKASPVARRQPSVVASGAANTVPESPADQ